MARLPIPGSDDGIWGDILNEFLGVSHASDGTVKSGAVGSTALNTGSGSDGQVLTKDSGASGGISWTSAAGSPDATTSSKGIVQLAGDLGGTAASPTVPGLANKANTSTTVSAGTGLTGGGDLSTNRTISANFGTTAGTIAQGNDSRITGAEQTANKGAASGYAALNASTVVPTAQLGSGTANSSTFLRGDSTWASPPGGVSGTDGGGETYFDAGNSSTAITLNLANGNVQKLTLTNNCTITLTSPAAGAMRALTLLVFQDATGSRTVTWPGSVAWGNAGAPVLTTTASKMDIISLFTVDGGTTWYGALGAKGF